MSKTKKQNAFDFMNSEQAIKARQLFTETAEQVKINPYAIRTKKAGCTVNASPIHISEKMTGKMNGIISISTCVLVNPVCIARVNHAIKSGNLDCICLSCFATGTTNHYNALRDNTVINSALLSTVILPLDLLPRFKNEIDIVRLESFGDTMNTIQAVNYINLCKVNPHVHFTVWTKNPGHYDTAFKAFGRPDNLYIGYSNPNRDRLPNVDDMTNRYPWIDFIFTVWTDRQTALDNGTDINCRGYNPETGETVDSCRLCMKCYLKRHKAGTVTLINELLK